MQCVNEMKHVGPKKKQTRTLAGIDGGHADDIEAAVFDIEVHRKASTSIAVLDQQHLVWGHHLPESGQFVEEQIDSEL